jgi:hypothetical protein
MAGIPGEEKGCVRYSGDNDRRSTNRSVSVKCLHHWSFGLGAETYLELSSGEIRQRGAKDHPIIFASINTDIDTNNVRMCMNLPVFFIKFLFPENKALING